MSGTDESSPAFTDPRAVCPLCGAGNACAMAAPEGEAGECWCDSARIPAGVLARVPEEARGRRCICARCAEAG